jgi:hypothetical protein
LVTAVALTVLVASSVGCRGDDGLRVSLVTDSTESVTEGMPVSVKGVEVGEVSGIRDLGNGSFELAVRIRDRYRGNVTTDARFSVRHGGADATSVAIVLDPGIGVTAAQGTVFELHTGWQDRLLAWSNETYRKITGTELEDDLQRFEELARQASDKGAAEWARVRPELERLSEKIGQELEKTGEESAERIERELERILEEMAADSSDS